MQRIAHEGAERAPSPRKPKCVTRKDCDYVYRDVFGRELFVKRRYRHDPCHCGREKSFGYLYRRDFTIPPEDFSDADWIYQKPKPWADWYLYRLESIWPVKGKVIYWCEGEKDADVLATGGRNRIPVDTTAHHQGAAVGATIEQAKLLIGAKLIYIVADLDPAGANDAWNRLELLEAAGYDGYAEVVRAREGNDAADHVEAGYTADQLVPVQMSAMRKMAERHRSTRAADRRAEYTGATR